MIGSIACVLFCFEKSITSISFFFEENRGALLPREYNKTNREYRKNKSQLAVDKREKNPSKTHLIQGSQKKAREPTRQRAKRNYKLLI
jgi:hypothetical protein